MNDKEMRELDAWVAEHVMGLPPCYVVIKRGLFYRLGDRGYTSKMSEAGRYTLEEAKAREWRHDEQVTYAPWQCEKYTTDPAAAMLVLEKCVARCILSRAEIGIGEYSDLDGFQGFKVHAFCFSSQKVEASSVAETLPLAICLFAKKLFQK